MGRKRNGPDASLTDAALKAVQAEVDQWGDRPIEQWPGGTGQTSTTAIAKAADREPKMVRKWRAAENYRAAVKLALAAAADARYAASVVDMARRLDERVDKKLAEERAKKRAVITQVTGREPDRQLPPDFGKDGKRGFYTWETIAELWERSGGQVESPIEAEIVDGEVRRKVYTDRDAYAEHLVRAGLIPSALFDRGTKK